MQDYFKIHELVSAKQIMDICGITHYNTFNRFLERHAITKSMNLRQGNKQLYTKKAANNIVDLWKKKQATGKQESIKSTELQDQLTKFKTLTNNRHRDTRDRLEQLDSLLFSYGLPDIIKLVLAHEQNLETKTSKIDNIHHTLKKQLDDQAILIFRLTETVRHLEDYIERSHAKYTPLPQSAFRQDEITEADNITEADSITRKSEVIGTVEGVSPPGSGQEVPQTRIISQQADKSKDLKKSEENPKPPKQSKPPEQPKPQKPRDQFLRAK